MKKVKIELNGQVIETSAVDAAMRMVKAGTAKLVQEPTPEEPTAKPKK